MKSLKFLIIGIVVSFLAISCNKDGLRQNEIKVRGIIQQQGITTYQYGTHTLGGYALRSSTITLDDYINQRVIIVGNKVQGYPVDGGPDYLEVKGIE